VGIPLAEPTVEAAIPGQAAPSRRIIMDINNLVTLAI
jgi:hypothetical protein